MKKTFLSTIVLCAFLFANEIKAQANFALNVNSNTHPGLRIANYYESQYYYFPEIDMYYDISNRRFVYFENNRWVYASSLPSVYGGYDVSRGYKVAINEYKPYLHGNEYREKYREYYENYNRRSQSMNNGSQGSGQYDRSYRNNNPSDGRNMQQDERIHTEANRNTEQNPAINNNSSGNTVHPQQNNGPVNQNNVTKDAQAGSSNINRSDRSENIKEDKHNETINNNNVRSQPNTVTKDAPVIPQGNSIAVPGNQSKEDAQRSQFYSNGQTNGVRDAVRNPKFNPGNGQTKSAQDSLRNIQPNIGKDTLHNSGPIIKGTGIQENNGTKSSQRNDHVV